MRRAISWLLALLAAITLGTRTAAAATEVEWIEAAPPGDYAQAAGPKDWDFPTDFGPHPDYKTEWWYYTGNLATAEGRPFGFQFTIFRQALTAEDEPGSPWRTPQIYSAHFTVSDIEAQRFYHEERFSRSTLGLAGAESTPYQVWIQDWSARTQADGAVQLQAATPEMAIDLVVRQSRSPVLQGDQGLSPKGPQPGNASYYYSLVQQPTQGTLTADGHTYSVTGITWKDHEYSTSALSPGTVGWDWFSAQFEDGTALMLYGLRHEDGRSEPDSAGKFITPAGETTLAVGDWTLTITDTWQSPHSGAIYPAGWQLQVPKLDLSLEIAPQMADQELNTATATYWEGALRYAGQRQGQPVRGQGYGELTGYADRLDSLLAER